MLAVQTGLLLLFEMNGWVVLSQLEGGQAAASTAPASCVQSETDYTATLHLHCVCHCLYASNVCCTRGAHTNTAHSP